MLDSLGMSVAPSGTPTTMRCARYASSPTRSALASSGSSAPAGTRRRQPRPGARMSRRISAAFSAPECISGSASLGASHTWYTSQLLLASRSLTLERSLKRWTVESTSLSTTRSSSTSTVGCSVCGGAYKSASAMVRPCGVRKAAGNTSEPPSCADSRRRISFVMLPCSSLNVSRPVSSSTPRCGRRATWSPATMLLENARTGHAAARLDAAAATMHGRHATPPPQRSISGTGAQCPRSSSKWRRTCAHVTMTPTGIGRRTSCVGPRR